MNYHDLDIMQRINTALHNAEPISDELLEEFDDLIVRLFRQKQIASQRAVKAIQRRRAVYADYATSKKQRAMKHHR